MITVNWITLEMQLDIQLQNKCSNAPSGNKMFMVAAGWNK